RVVVDADDRAAAVCAQPGVGGHAGHALDHRTVHAAMHNSERLQQLWLNLELRARPVGGELGEDQPDVVVERCAEFGWHDGSWQRLHVFVSTPTRASPTHQAWGSPIEWTGGRCSPQDSPRSLRARRTQHRQGCPNFARGRREDWPRTGSPKPTSASSTAWPRRIALSSSTAVSCGSCVAEATTAEPTICHIAATENAPKLTVCNWANSGANVRWQRCATHVVNAASLGSRTIASGAPPAKQGSSGSARSVGSTTAAQSMAPSASTWTHRFSIPVSQARPSVTTSATTRPTTVWTSVVASSRAAERTSMSAAAPSNIICSRLVVSADASGHHRRSETSQSTATPYTRGLWGYRSRSRRLDSCSGSVRLMAIAAISGSSTWA